jgi:hypothetical protein
MKFVAKLVMGPGNNGEAVATRPDLVILDFWKHVSRSTFCRRIAATVKVISSAIRSLRKVCQIPGLWYKRIVNH